MKIKNAMLISCVIALTSCVSPSVYTVKVLKHEKNYFAASGEGFENRYDAVVCEVLNGKKHVCDLAVYQHWFKKNRKDYPAVGAEIPIKQFDFKEQMFKPVRGLYTIELDEFEKLKIGSSNKTFQRTVDPRRVNVR